MKKGTLITSSSLPAGDTEIHHHSMIRRAEFPYPPLGLLGMSTLAMDGSKSTSIKQGTLCKALVRWKWLRTQFKLRLGGMKSERDDKSLA